MKKRPLHRKNMIAAMMFAAFAFLPVAAFTPGCGNRGGGQSASPSASPGGSPGAEFLADGSLAPAPYYDQSQQALYGGPVRQTFRNVGAAGCSAYRVFSNSTIISGGDVYITFVLSGCSVSLESFVFSDNIPAGLTVTPLRVESKTGAGATSTVAYTYETAVAPTNYHHWYLDDVPVDGTAELAANTTLVIYYKVTDDGSHAAGYTYNFSLFLWAGHELPIASLNHDWGYADAPVTISVGIPPAGSSGALTTTAVGYTTSRAFDGDYAKVWAGLWDVGSWDLYYGFPAVQHIDDVFINYQTASFTPTTTTVYYSSDGLIWTNAGNMPAGTKPSMNINANMKYLRFKMTGNPPGRYPIIRDIDWLPVTESTASSGGLGFGPSSDADWYFPSYAFDNNAATWWVGTNGAGPWDLYYHFATSTIVNQTTMYFNNPVFLSTSNTLEYSANGSAWTSAGTFPAVFTTTLTVAKKTDYLHYRMSGTPPNGYPLINDIKFSSPTGASGGISQAGYTPSRAFDGSMATVWVGKAGEGSWYLFYGYAVATLFGTATVYYNTAADVPSTSTNIYLSNDGVTWIYWGVMPAGTTPALLVNRTVKYICFEMLGAPASGTPIVKEITY